jgi:hypothetical protein
MKKGTIQKKKKRNQWYERIERRQSQSRKLWTTSDETHAPKSIYEKVQKELTHKSRDELLERFEKRWNFLWENSEKVKKTYPKFSHAQNMTNEELIEAIAHIESDLAINTDRETAIAFLQNQKRFKGRQKGRVDKSFHEH